MEPAPRAVKQDSSRLWRTRRRRIRSTVARLVRVLLILVLIGPFAFWFLNFSFGIGGDLVEPWDNAYVLLASLYLALVFGLLWVYWRLQAPTAEQALAQDPRPPVLYLRSFAADRNDTLVQLVNVFGGGVDPTFEQRFITDLGTHVGPVIAVGRPGEWLPPLGAARMYITDDKWREEVGRLVRVSALVVLRAGKSPGLEWELRQVVRSESPKGLMLLLPKRAYTRFREWANAILPQPLPEDWPGEAVTFRDDWSPLATSVEDWIGARTSKRLVWGHGSLRERLQRHRARRHRPLRHPANNRDRDGSTGRATEQS